MINTPTNTIGSARELENLIDTYRGQITLQEQQITQNNKVLVNQEYTIGQNALKINEQDEFIAVKDKVKTEIEKEIISLEESKDSLLKDVQDLSHEVSELQDEKNALVSDISGEKDKLDTFSKELISKEKELSKREKDIEKKETIVNEKIEIIKNLKSSL